MRERTDTDKAGGPPGGAAGTAASGQPAVLEPYRVLLDQLDAGLAVTPERSALVDGALRVWARPGFDTFMCLPRLRFEPFPYQLEAAARVLRHMQGRAILADEVGSGRRSRPVWS